MQYKQLIKNPSKCIEHDEEIIYSTNSLDYFLTYNSNTGTVFCYGNQKLDLSHFLIPGITSKISAESGEFLLNSNIFKNIIDLFYIKEPDIYFILRITDNSKSSEEALNETVFLFVDKKDCLDFNSVLCDISLKYKTDYLKLNKQKGSI